MGSAALGAGLTLLMASLHERSASSVIPHYLVRFLVAFKTCLLLNYSLSFLTCLHWEGSSKLPSLLLVDIDTLWSFL